jgi:hypothetical protein
MNTEQIKQKIDVSKAYDYSLLDYPYRISEYDSLNKKLHRIVTLEEILKIKERDRTDIFSDIKASYLVFDVRYLLGLGYKELYYLDLVPGDTVIGYDIYVEDENISSA